MMSTNTMSGWWSAIFDSASKPSTAVNTSQPSRASRVSAVRRMVLLSSMTSTLRPASRGRLLLAALFSMPDELPDGNERREHDAKWRGAARDGVLTY